MCVYSYMYTYIYIYKPITCQPDMASKTVVLKHVPDENCIFDSKESILKLCKSINIRALHATQAVQLN